MAWRDCFLIDPRTGRRPARAFLDALEEKAAQQILAVVLAVRDAPPPAFRGGGKWEAMHGDMAGFYEIRVRQGQLLHRLFCLLDRSTAVPTLLLVSGGTKPNHTAMDPGVYADAIRLRNRWRAAVEAGVDAELVDCGN